MLHDSISDIPRPIEGISPAGAKDIEDFMS
jgi:hypothetical protein